MSRSEAHPTYYRVGKWRGKDVYWCPVTGYAVEIDEELWGLTPESLDETELFADADDCEKLLDAVYESNWLLLNAMTGRMLSTVKAWLNEDIREAGEAAQAKKEARYG